ncbi:NADAR family protein [Sphingobacterium sp. E70]|uniref:NADAR family protein n=1 Tax=Sphingobacterium sp. E70 TaxID=2853439 RepID=UPI00211C483A|nr:NADAR family protein [Sphingobacterium sp. E70]ULT26911.1 NADAR family protein [Sphingobacterium sp. E70]
MSQYNIKWLKERFENGDMFKFIFFWGHSNNQHQGVGKFIFSQWYESAFTVDNITYKTAEHWMMAHKALLFGDKKNFEKIINCHKPGEAKDLGRQVIGYDDQIWNERKFEIVKLGNIHKFNQHPELAAYMLNTESRILVEASPVDDIWGIGMSQDDSDIENIYCWRGQNLLGFALMEVRDLLNQFGHFEPLENALLTPWSKFPDKDAMDMFWKMGAGEEYIVEFSNYYDNLNEREKTIFQLTNPQPYQWLGFYS